MAHIEDFLWAEHLPPLCQDHLVVVRGVLLLELSFRLCPQRRVRVVLLPFVFELVEGLVSPVRGSFVRDGAVEHDDLVVDLDTKREGCLGRVLLPVVVDDHLVLAELGFPRKEDVLDWINAVTLHVHVELPSGPPARVLVAVPDVLLTGSPAVDVEVTCCIPAQRQHDGTVDGPTCQEEIPRREWGELGHRQGGGAHLLA